MEFCMIYVRVVSVGGFTLKKISNVQIQETPSCTMKLDELSNSYMYVIGIPILKSPVLEGRNRVLGHASSLRRIGKVMPQPNWISRALVLGLDPYGV